MARAAFAQAAAQAGKIDVLGREVQLKASTLGLVATPQIDPGVEDSPLMTWGEIEGTPFRLDGGDIVAGPAGPTFKVCFFFFQSDLFRFPRYLIEKRSLRL